MWTLKGRENRQETVDLAPEERLLRLNVCHQFWRIEHDGNRAGALHAGVQGGGCSAGAWRSIAVVSCKGSEHFGTRRAAKDEVMDWLQFYNHRRLHSTLGYLRPMNFEKAKANERKGLGEEERKTA